MKKLNKALLSAFLVLLILAVLPLQAFAESFSLAMPASIELQGSKPAKAPSFRLELKPLSPGAPMPQGCEDSCVLQFSGAGSKKFPAIEFTNPGRFLYSITQLPMDAKYYTIDGTKYQMEVIIQYDGGSLYPTVVLSREGNDEKANELLFVNSYNPPPGPHPKTGDGSNLTGYAVLLGISAVSMSVLLIILKKRRE